MKAKTAFDIPPRKGSGYPSPFRERVAGREKRALGDAFGLDKFGVNLTVLPPGCESSMRHWHEREDELVYVLEGELLLRTDAGDEVMSAGMVAGFRAGDADAHQLVNAGTMPAVYLEIGNRIAGGDVAYYADVDLALIRDANGRLVYATKDGKVY